MQWLTSHHILSAQNRADIQCFPASSMDEEMKTNAKTQLWFQFCFIALLAFSASSGFLPGIQPNAGIINGNFETGNLNGWNTTGHVSVTGPGIDPITDNALEKVAEGKYSAMIGNEIPWINGEPQSSSMEQTIELDQTLASDAVLEFVYAVVADDPPGHPEIEKPMFRVLVSDLTSDKKLLDTEYLYTNQSSADWYLGIDASNQPYALANDRWIFRPWKLVSIPLNGMGGHKLNILLEVRDCNYGAHAIYGFLDGVRVGSHEDVKLPGLAGNPQSAVYIEPPAWAPLLSMLEKSGLGWLCCLIPLLLLLVPLLFWLLRRRSRPQTSDPIFAPPPKEEPTPSGLRGGIRKKLNDDDN